MLIVGIVGRLKGLKYQQTFSEGVFSVLLGGKYDIRAQSASIERV